MKIYVSVLLMLLGTATLARGQQADRCRLDESVVRTYAASNASDRARGAARRAISDFIGCDPSSVDGHSRAVFYRVVELQFQQDHADAILRWRKDPSRSNPEGLYDALATHEAELRDYLDRLFDASRDAEFAPVVLRFGKARAIASLGRHGRNDVLNLLSVPNRPYGVGGNYNAQVEAIGAIGFWINPSNAAFARQEKTAFVKVLTDLLDMDAEARRTHPSHSAASERSAGHASTLIETALEALGRSDDEGAARSVQVWMDMRDPNDPLRAVAAKALASIHKNRNGNKQ